MKRYVLPLILLLLLFGCTGNKPNLSASFLPSSLAKPYEGDAVAFSVNVVNNGSVEAKEFNVEISINNASFKTDTLTLHPNSNQTLSYSWYPYSGGEYDIVARVDPGNLVSDASPNKQSTMHISVLSVQAQSIFSALPDRNLQNVGVTYITAQGISSASTYLPSISGLSVGTLSFVLPYIKSFRGIGIGNVDYADKRSALVLFIRGTAPVEQVASLLATFVKLQTNANSSLQYTTINGTNVALLSSSVLPSPVCIWREEGWTKVTFYIDSLTLETCSSLFGMYNSSYAETPLSVGNELARQPPFNATLLGENLQLSNLTNITTYAYGVAFEDSEGFYGYYVTEQPYTPQNYTCLGSVVNRSSMQVCETPQTNSTWTAVQRRVGNYTIACLSTPKSGQLTTSIEQKAVDLCFSLNYSGEERGWINVLNILRPKTCEFPNGFSCLSYDFSNNTLNLNLTQNTGKTVVLDSFGCSSQENASTAPFKLTAPVTLPSNSSVTLSSPCYDNTGGLMNGTYSYFSSKLYLSYSAQGSNESAIVGNLTINNQ